MAATKIMLAYGNDGHSSRIVGNEDELNGDEVLFHHEPSHKDIKEKFSGFTLFTGYAYSNNGLTWRTVTGPDQVLEGEKYFDHKPNDAELKTAFPEYSVVNTKARMQEFSDRISQGINITAPSGLAGRYQIDDQSQAIITGIYVGIKGGDGLPGGSPNFTFFDADGQPHEFNEAQFSSFAKCVRDLVYNLKIASTQEQPQWPANTCEVA